MNKVQYPTDQNRDAVVKIYKCFYLYNVRVTKIQNRANVELKILSMTVCAFLFPGGHRVDFRNV